MIEDRTSESSIDSLASKLSYKDVSQSYLHASWNQRSGFEELWEEVIRLARPKERSMNSPAGRPDPKGDAGRRESSTDLFRRET